MRRPELRRCSGGVKEAAIEEEASTIVTVVAARAVFEISFEELDPPYSDVATLLPVP